MQLFLKGSYVIPRASFNVTQWIGDFGRQEKGGKDTVNMGEREKVQGTWEKVEGCERNG